jgi:hypothetical protein
VKPARDGDGGVAGHGDIPTGFQPVDMTLQFVAVDFGGKGKIHFNRIAGWLGRMLVFSGGINSLRFWLEEDEGNEDRDSRPGVAGAWAVGTLLHS